MSELVRVIHGDCREVLPTLEPGSIDLVIADPPYGARRPSARRLAIDRFDEIEGNDAVRSEWLLPVHAAIKEGGAIYLFTCWDKMEEWRSALQLVGFKVRSCIIWDKGVHGLADLETCWAPQHEMILFAAKGRHVLRGKRPKDVINTPRVDPGKLLHPYQKPVKAILPLIEASSSYDDLVLDPFAGCGSTGVSCQKSGRRCILIEKDGRYVPVIHRRLADAATPLFDSLSP